MATINEIKKSFEEYKNSASKSAEIMNFKEKVIGLVLQVLCDPGQPNQK